MLEIDKISKRYNKDGVEINALTSVSVSVAAGEFVLVSGASGSGKTTLLLAAGGLMKPHDGHVIIDGQNPYQLGDNQRSELLALKTGFVFQQFHLIPYLNVFDNIAVRSGARSSRYHNGRAEELIEKFGLSDRVRHYPAELSTGEKQRVALARAVYNKPTLILADEPTGNLDGENSRIVLTFLSEFAKNGGAVLTVSHDTMVAEFASRSVQLKDGEIAPEAGTYLGSS